MLFYNVSALYISLQIIIRLGYLMAIFWKRAVRINQKKIPTPKTEVGKTKLTIRYLYHENISQAEVAAI